MQHPTGGPKDSLPPKILSELPKNYTRNFKAKKIVLEFDEYVKLNSQFKEFSISPDVDTQPEYKIKKKNLEITLPDSLEENTTYTIHFGKGLVDYNEGNPLPNYSYVFATGNELDSLSISGSVLNGYTKSLDMKNQDKDVMVILIPTRQDSIFGKRKANIFTAVDTAGNFKFNNLREDTYRIYALKEKSSNRIYESTDDWIGFLNDSIVLRKDTSNIKLEFTKPYPDKFRTGEKKLEKDGGIQLVFNRPLLDPAVKILSPQELDASKYIRYGVNKDSALIYTQNTDFDSLKLEIRNYNTVMDTVLIKKGVNVKFEKEILPVLNISNKVDKITHITVTSKMPLASIDKSKVKLTEDSIARTNFQLQKDTLNDQLYHIRFNWKPKRNYTLVLEEKALTGLFGDHNKEFKTNFTLDESENYGDINFNFTNTDSTMQYVVELIDDKKEKVFNRQILGPNNTISYKKFPGGKYSLRVIFDANRNGVWDPADVKTRKQAENIWYLNKTFTIRANWEQNETVNIN
ncbi:Ig-like domain-containing protein [Sphingobacterium spiritivorum]|nr:Ig-like domain-containing protein [Sphingobacterium spiritivorum]